MSGDIHDDEWVTQYIFAGRPPRNFPRPQDTDGLSTLRGRLSLEEAARFVRLQVHMPYAGDRVRYALVGSLRAVGFTVLLTASRRNPVHVSISREAQWRDEDRPAFDSCFEPSTSPNRDGDQ